MGDYPVHKQIPIAAEWVVIFLGLPILFVLSPIPLPKVPTLILIALFCLVILFRDPTFRKAGLWNSKELKGYLKIIFLRFTLISILLLIRWLS